MVSTARAAEAWIIEAVEGWPDGADFSPVDSAPSGRAQAALDGWVDVHCPPPTTHRCC